MVDQTACLIQIQQHLEMSQKQYCGWNKQTKYYDKLLYIHDTVVICTLQSGQMDHIAQYFM